MKTRLYVPDVRKFCAGFAIGALLIVGVDFACMATSALPKILAQSDENAFDSPAGMAGRADTSDGGMLWTQEEMRANSVMSDNDANGMNTMNMDTDTVDTVDIDPYSKRTNLGDRGHSSRDTTGATGSNIDIGPRSTTERY